MKINVIDLGKMAYNDALDIQKRLLLLRQQKLWEDTLLLVEHPPVLTIGRTGNKANILLPREELKSQGISVYDISRGGDVTYHGPGQVVGYPIIDLNNFGKDIKVFVCKLEDVFINLLNKEYGIKAYRDEKKYTGVWVGDEKITAIGIEVKKWVTMHGFAFNVNTNLEHFRWINPCGITDRGVTSIQKLIGHPLNFDDIKMKVIDYFCNSLEVQAVPLAKNQLLDHIQAINVKEHTASQH